MKGIDPRVIVHKLSVYSSYKPVKQKRRNFTPNEEVSKLFKVKSVQEVDYPSWFANVVLLKKINRK